MKDFKFNCPGCGQKVQASEDMIGDSVECPICRQMLTVTPPAQSPDAKDKPPEPNKSAPVKCAFCKGDIPHDSVFCDLCGKRQPTSSPPAAPLPPSVFSPDKGSDKNADRPVGLLALILPVIIFLAAGVLFFYFKQMRDSRPPAADDVPESVVRINGEEPDTPDDDDVAVVAIAPSAPPPREDTQRRPAPPPPPPPRDDERRPPPPPPPPREDTQRRPPPRAAEPAPEPAPEQTAPPAAEEPAEDDAMVLFEKTRERYREVLADIDSNHQSRITQVQTNFLSSLTALERNLQEQGELMGVLEVRKEVEAFQKIREQPPVIRTVTSPYPDIAALKKAYNSQLETLGREREKERVIRTRQYDNRLVAFERQLTQAGKIDQALIVHKERERIRTLRDTKIQ